MLPRVVEELVVANDVVLFQDVAPSSSRIMRQFSALRDSCSGLLMVLFVQRKPSCCVNVDEAQPSMTLQRGRSYA